MATHDFSNLIRAGFIEARRILDPEKKLLLTAPNTQTALVLSSSFPIVKILKEARFDEKIPVRVTMLQEDFVRLAIVDRCIVQIVGHKLSVIVIDKDDPVEPLVDLTLAEYA